MHRLASRQLRFFSPALLWQLLPPRVYNTKHLDVGTKEVAHSSGAFTALGCGQRTIILLHGCRSPVRCVGGKAMDCDHVFMILTRGPFPTGEAWDEEVEAHLETCAECWRLAEALRPALEVFQEAVPPAESRDLPGYWGDARPASAVVAELVGAAPRTALAAHVQHISRHYRNDFGMPLAEGLSTNVLRAIVLASTVTATVIGLLLLLRG